METHGGKDVRNTKAWSLVRDKIEEAEWKYLHVNEHWQQMKNNYNDGNSIGHMWNVKRFMQT